VCGGVSTSNQANNRLVPAVFKTYLEDQRGVTALNSLEFINCRRYAQHLRERAFRDRTLVTMLALTGVRGAELFANPSQRAPLRPLEERCRNKKGVCHRIRQDTGTPADVPQNRVVESLERYRTVLDPATGDCPVFPTRHHASLARAVEGGLEAQGCDAEEIEVTLDESMSMEILREHGIAPPALSKNGAWSLTKRLCETAGIATGGEYVKLHGGRRGLGSDLYAQDAELS
jgi:hypothetical protein